MEHNFGKNLNETRLLEALYVMLQKRACQILRDNVSSCQIGLGNHIFVRIYRYTNVQDSVFRLG